MKTKLYLYIILRIVIFISLAMAFSYIPENCREFLGDTIKENPRGGVDEYYNWGTRHYWLHIGGILLALVSIADAVISIIKFITKVYPNLKD